MIDKIVLAVIMCLLSFDSIESLPTVNQFFISQPEDTKAVLGTQAKLSCAVGNIQGRCQWTKNGLGLGQDQELEAYPRLRMDEDVCDLVIDPVLPSDEGIYQCQVGAVQGVAPLASNQAQLTVVAEPGKPYITQAALSDVLEVSRGEEIVLECESIGGKPAASITWTDNSGHVYAKDASEKQILMEDGSTSKTVSTLRFVPEEDMQMICSAANNEFPLAKTSAIAIKHLREPKVYLETENPRILTGDSLEIECKADAYPVLVNYKWFINGQELFSEKTAKLKITGISQRFDKSVVKCVVTNKAGSGESSMVLDVGYAPTVLEQPEDKLSKPGDSVTFKCLAESNPAPTYVWINKRTNKVVGFKADLIVKAGDEKEEFVCKIFAEGFKDIESRVAKLEVVLPPKIIKVTEGKIGEEFVLHCTAQSNGKNTRISWIVDESPMDINDKNYETIYNHEGALHNSFLVFKDMDRKSQKHACFVSNEVGSDVREAEASAKSSATSVAATIMIILFLLLLLLVVLPMAIFYYRKQRSLSVDKMEAEKQMTNLSTPERQPCLEKTGFLNHNFITPSNSFASCNTLNTSFARSISCPNNRSADRRMIGF